MNKRTLRRLISVLAVLALGLSLLVFAVTALMR